ncbi:hypothetical protein GOBAR_DD34812 [Gossypium barbadense]|nr:hypothetical protein GOBAR_DD34812 [Gossypium barbadense]
MVGKVAKLDFNIDIRAGRNVTENLRVKFGESRFNVLTVVNGNEEGKGSEIDDLQKVSIKGKGVRDEARFRGNNQIFDLIWKRFGQVVLLGLGNKSGIVSSKGGSQAELGGLSLGESRFNPKAHDKDLAQVNELGFVNLVKLVGFGKAYRPAGAKEGQDVLATLERSSWELKKMMRLLSFLQISINNQAHLEIVVMLKEGVLDPSKHSMIIFKENIHPNLFEVVEVDQVEVMRQFLKGGLLEVKPMLPKIEGSLVRQYGIEGLVSSC